MIWLGADAEGIPLPIVIGIGMTVLLGPVLQHLQTMFCAYGFGVKLQAEAWVLVVCERHDGAICGVGDGGEGGVAEICYCEGVVAHGGEGGWDVAEQGVAGVSDLACFAVHGVGCVYELCAEIHAEGLVAEAYAEYGDAGVEVIDSCHGDACLQRCFGARGEDEAGGVEGD